MKKLLMLLFLVAFVIGCSSQASEPKNQQANAPASTTTTVKAQLTPVRISCPDWDCMNQEEDKVLAKLLSTFHNNCEPPRYYIMDYAEDGDRMAATVKIQRNGNICNYMAQVTETPANKAPSTETLICELPLSVLSEFTEDHGPNEDSPYCWVE
jgi:outer membrane receptor for ferric coprogen and ferric-rhodotorulic acid